MSEPSRLHLYWEFARDPVEVLRRAFPEKAANYRLVVILDDQRRPDQTQMYELGAAREQWFDVCPDGIYRATIGFHAHAPEHLFIPLLKSEEVQTPAVPAIPTVESPVCAWARRLYEAGDERAALNFLFAMLDLAQPGAASEVAQRLFQVSVQDPSLTEERELRGLLIDLALGKDYNDALDDLESNSLRDWLLEARMAADSVNPALFQAKTQRLFEELCSMINARTAEAKLSECRPRLHWRPAIYIYP